MSAPGPRRRWWPEAAAVLGLGAAFWSQVRWVRVTNFGGFDEWLIIWLTSRGIVDFPYARRPLELLWVLPSPLLFPHRLGGFRVLHAVYLFLGGLIVYGLCRRLAPGHRALAFLAAAFSLTWAPRDPVRLQIVESLAYAGLTFGVLLALLLLVESWTVASRLGLALGMAVGFATTLSYESALPLLAAGPLLLLPLALRPSRRFWTWTAAWEAMVAVATARLAWQFLGAGSYQGAMGLDLRPLTVGARLARQFALHLLPLAQVPAGTDTAAAVSALVGAGACIFAVGRDQVPGGPPGRRLCAAAMAAGLALAGCGYAFFVLSAAVHEAERTQFLSAPGIGLFLAGMAGLLAASLPGRFRLAALAVAAAWTVGLGTAHVVALQREWDATTYYPGQRGALAGLVAAAPDLRPHTLVVLVDEPRAWRATFGFRAAVEYLYERRATGVVPAAWSYLFPTSFRDDGIHTEPHPEIQGPWDCPPTHHRYHEVVVARADRAGALQILDRWPDVVLPPLPPGAVYDPQARIVRGGPVPPSRRILDAP
jgi:hypothetical protein